MQDVLGKAMGLKVGFVTGLDEAQVLAYPSQQLRQALKRGGNNQGQQVFIAFDVQYLQKMLDALMKQEGEPKNTIVDQNGFGLLVMQALNERKKELEEILKDSILEAWERDDKSLEVDGE